MLDISLVRASSDKARANLAKRQDDEVLKNFDLFVEQDKEWRSKLQELEKQKAARNVLTQQINEAKQQKKEFDSLILQARELGAQIQQNEKRVSELRLSLDQLAQRMPNLLHDSVPFGKSDVDNKVVRKWGKEFKPKFELQHHGALAVKLGIADFEGAVKISGEGFYILKGPLALLNNALQQLAIEMLVKKGFQLVNPPLMVRHKAMDVVTSLDAFEDMLYKVQDHDLYLIATSEHPIGSMLSGQVFNAEQLPLKFAGISPCFRKEVGKHGLDERGLFRVHQFDKVEQFVYCTPEQSWKLHEELIANAEQFMKALKIPYRIVNVCTGDIGIVAAKKYDVEGWSPREQKYIELCSASNCTTWQSIRANVKFRKGEDKQYVHTLNATMVATPRVLRLILENFQQKDGSVKIPAALHKYMHGVKTLELPKPKAGKPKEKPKAKFKPKTKAKVKAKSAQNSKKKR
ncbi:MAG: serine--tRNA ligase [Candidatus Diapherotrites archaeon]